MANFFSFLSSLHELVPQTNAWLGFLWLSGALILLIFEAGTPGLFFFISFAIGAFCTAPFAFMDCSFISQSTIWVVCSLIALLILRNLGKTRVVYKSNTEALVGQEATVIIAIEPHKSGKVKVKGDEWLAIARNDLILQKGTVVTIIGLQGNKLIVQ